MVYGTGWISFFVLFVIAVVATGTSTDTSNDPETITTVKEQASEEKTSEDLTAEEKATQEKATVEKAAKDKAAKKKAAEEKAAEEKKAEKKAAYDKKLKNKICQDLISKGIDEKVAIKALDLISKYDLPVWSSKDDIFMENASKDDYIFSYTAYDGAFSMIYAVHVLEGDIVEIVDENTEVIYNTEGLNKDYVFYSYFDLDTTIEYSKTVVTSVLKSPSTAEYPGSWLDPYEDWRVSKDKNIFTLSSYVDSQNSFGAMLRSNFVFQFRYVDEETMKPIYFEFDGEVLVDEE